MMKSTGAWICRKRKHTLPRNSRRDKNCDGLFCVLGLVGVALLLVLDVLRMIFYKIPITLYRCCCKTRVDPFNMPPTKCVVFNGYAYTTAHFHDVDGADVVEDCEERVRLDLYFKAGFEIAPGDENDVAVTIAHPWGSMNLAFADTRSCVTTSLGGVGSSVKGARPHFCTK